MIQNIDFETDLPHVPTKLFFSPSNAIEQLIRETLECGTGGFAPRDGSEPLVDPDDILFPMPTFIGKPATNLSYQLEGDEETTWSALLGEKAAA
jgi:hypothetical protein